MSAPGKGGAAAQVRADALKHRMQRRAQGLMTLDPAADWKAVQAEAGELRVPVHRVAMCHRWTSGAPALWRAPAGDNAEFSEVYTCGSVWACPICAPKITTGRRNELLAAIAAWRDRGGEVYLGTRTFSHSRDGLPLLGPVPEGKRRPSSPLLETFAGALSRAKGARGACELAERAGVVGTVRALEATHGEMNGWHPHTHELIFALPGQRARLLSHRSAWVRLLEKRGLAGLRAGMTRAERAEQLRYLRRHAYTVQLGDKAADYVAKFGMEPMTESGGRWGPGSELVKGYQKTGDRLSGRTPFELLRRSLPAEQGGEGDKRAGMLFREFALVFQGRAQLYWSPGLRAALAELCEVKAAQVYYVEGASAEQLAWSARARYIGRDLSDEDIAATRAPECTEFVYRFAADDWRVVLRTDARHDVLLAAQFGGADAVRDLLAQLRRGWATHGDEFIADWRRFERGRWRHEFGVNPMEAD